MDNCRYVCGLVYCMYLNFYILVANRMPLLVNDPQQPALFFPSSPPPPPPPTHTHRSIASHFPTSCISVLRTSAYPTSLKRMVNHLGDIKAHYRTLAVPMPSYAMATLPVFALAAGYSAWEAVNYCDGDGGSIVVEQFPSLSKYLQQQNVTTHSLAAPRCTLVQVRQFIIACTPPPPLPPCAVLRSVHDAGELGNLYTVATREDDEPGPSTRHASTSICDRTMATRLSSMLVTHWRLHRCVPTAQRWGLK